MSVSVKFNLPWHQAEHYWLCILPKGGSLASSVVSSLQTAGMRPLHAQSCMALRAERNWGDAWRAIHQALKASSEGAEVEAAVVAGEGEPDPQQINMARKSLSAVDSIAGSLWLGDALLEDRLMCYFQPVVSASDKVFGYESFVRAMDKDGKLIGGDYIIAASRALNLEYVIDRYLHVQAIKAFVGSQFSGFLFINLFPGFIQRPEVYLEGLSESARAYGVVPKYIVLDFTHSEAPHDIQHLKRVTEYCRAKGYSIALDDISTITALDKLAMEIHPDYIKLDRRLSRQLAHAPERELVSGLLQVAHKNNALVIAEGVETEDDYKTLQQLGVTLFQGYYFSPPVPAEEIKVNLQKSTRA